MAALDPGTPRDWLPYLRTDDVGAFVDAAMEAEGHVVTPPSAIDAPHRRVRCAVTRGGLDRTLEIVRHRPPSPKPQPLQVPAAPQTACRARAIEAKASSSPRRSTRPNISSA